MTTQQLSPRQISARRASATQAVSFETRRLAELVGATITGIAVEDFNGEAITVLSVRTAKGVATTLAALRDAEGNGPGFLDFDPAGAVAQDQAARIAAAPIVCVPPPAHNAARAEAGICTCPDCFPKMVAANERAKVAQKVADAFDRGLREALTPAEYEQVVKLNRREKDLQVCHSHDYVDANEIMEAAMAEHSGLADVTVMTEDVAALWNQAWDRWKWQTTAKAVR